MSIKKYRKEIEQSVAKAEKELSAAAAKIPGDPESLRKQIADKKTGVRKRAEALTHLAHADSSDGVPEEALDCLANPEESVIVRRTALELLQAQQIFNPTAAEWRPRFLDGLRTALDEPKLRKQALEILSLQKDRKTQKLLLDGIRDPKKALVPEAEALRLASSDVHAGVLKVARELASDQKSKKDKDVFDQALRILANDPKSVGRLKEVLGDKKHSLESRKLAATALSNLSPKHLKPPTPKRAARAARESSGAKPRDALSKHIETLLRFQE